MKTFVLLFLAAVTVCHALPTGSPSQGGLQDLLSATVQLKSWVNSFVQASENGLTADELARLKSGATDADVKVKDAVEKLKNIPGVDKLTVTSSHVLETLENDIKPNASSTILTLLMSDSLMLDDVKLQLFLQIFKKRMQSLAVTVRQIRALLNQPDEPTADAIEDVARAVVTDKTAVLLIIGAAAETFEDADVVGRPLARAAQEEEEEDTSSGRVRRSAAVPASRGGWRWVNGKLVWRPTCIKVILGWVYKYGIKVGYLWKWKCF